jgi:3-oxoadipate enol-lactonase
MRLMLVHGFGGSHEDFTDWLPAFAGIEVEAVAVSLPRSEGSFAGLASFVLDSADRLGWSRFVLFGHSMGGMVAQLVALHSPERLAGLVLMGTTHGPIPADLDVVELGKAVVRGGGMAALVEAQRGRPGTAAHERLLRERPGYRSFMEAKALAMDPAAWVALVDEMVGQVDRLDALRSLALATLVVVGAQDEFLDDCRRIAAAVPGAQLVVVPDAGHSPQFEAPEAWWSAVSVFLQSLQSEVV